MTTYKATSGAVFRSLGWLALFGLPAATVVALLLVIPVPMSGALFFLIGIPVFILGAGVALCLFLLVTVLYHCVRISESGIACHRWPLKTIQAGWEQAERIQCGRFLNRNKARLYIRRREPGYEFKLGPWMLGSAAFDIVPLSDFSGWKDGRMAAEIRKYAPRLLSGQEIGKGKLPDLSRN